MSKSEYKFEVALGIEQVGLICRKAIAEMKWRMMEQGNERFVCKEVSPGITSFTNAAQVEIVLTPKSPNATGITFKGSISGFGPIQSGHLKGQMGNLKNQIQIMVEEQLLNKRDVPTQPESGGGYCSKCGGTKIQGDKFCSHCGAVQ